MSSKKAESLSELKPLLSVQSTKEDQIAFTKERYDEIKKRADERGIKILTKWRKGLKNIRVEPIVLGEY